MGEFSEKVFRVVAQIPAGKVATYGQVARLIGSARSARYVGFALRNNPSPAAIEFAKRFLAKDESSKGTEDSAKANNPTDQELSGNATTMPSISPRGTNPTDQEFPGAEPVSRLIPCHRVVFADGALCRGFAFGGPEVQRAMLQEEGVTFVDDDHTDLADCQWDGTMFALDGEDAGMPKGAPTTPPADFDWAAELGEG